MELMNPFNPEVTAPLKYIFQTSFDLSNLKAEERDNVLELLKICRQKEESPISDAVIGEMQRVLGEREYGLLKKVYFDTYNPETNQFAKYVEIEDKEDSVIILRTFETLFSMLPVLRDKYRQAAAAMKQSPTGGNDNA